MHLVPAWSEHSGVAQGIGGIIEPLVRFEHLAAGFQAEGDFLRGGKVFKVESALLFFGCNLIGPGLVVVVRVDGKPAVGRLQIEALFSVIPSDEKVCFSSDQF